MSGFETLVLIVVVVGLFYYISMNYGRKHKDFCRRCGGYECNCGGGMDSQMSPQAAQAGSAATNNPVQGSCGDNVGQYYFDKYSSQNDYTPASGDTRNYNTLQKRKMLKTHEGDWANRMNGSMGGSYTDSKGNSFGKVNDQGTTSNMDINTGYSVTPKSVSGGGMGSGENMTNTDRNSPLEVNDLLPDPCLNKNKDWTNVFSECDNLLGGQNFVTASDEHFTNQVLDVRCTKYSSLAAGDLRRVPAIQYSDVSIWQKPSVCKNSFDYLTGFE